MVEETTLSPPLESALRDIEVLLAKANPGAWKVDEDDRPGMEWNRHIYAGEEQRICFMAHSSGRDPDRDYANAHLITVLVNAAPAIVAALRAHLKDIQDG